MCSEGENNYIILIYYLIDSHNINEDHAAFL